MSLSIGKKTTDKIAMLVMDGAVIAFIVGFEVSLKTVRLIFIIHFEHIVIHLFYNIDELYQ